MSRYTTFQIDNARAHLARQLLDNRAALGISQHAGGGVCFRYVRIYADSPYGFVDLTRSAAAVFGTGLVLVDGCRCAAVPVELDDGGVFEALCAAAREAFGDEGGPKVPAPKPAPVKPPRGGAAVPVLARPAARAAARR